MPLGFSVPTASAVGQRLRRSRRCCRPAPGSGHPRGSSPVERGRRPGTRRCRSRSGTAATCRRGRWRLSVGLYSSTNLFDERRSRASAGEVRLVDDHPRPVGAGEGGRGDQGAEAQGCHAGHGEGTGAPPDSAMRRRGQEAPPLRDGRHRCCLLVRVRGGSGKPPPRGSKHARMLASIRSVSDILNGVCRFVTRCSSDRQDPSETPHKSAAQVRMTWCAGAQGSGGCRPCGLFEILDLALPRVLRKAVPEVEREAGEDGPLGGVEDVQPVDRRLLLGGRRGDVDETGGRRRPRRDTGGRRPAARCRASG